MSAAGSADQAPQLSPRLQQIVAFASAFARPFATYAGAIAVFIGVIRINNVEALCVAAAMAGVYGVARSFDKRA